MTKKELEEKLLAGVTMDQLFDFCDGQECLIYKGEFEVSDEIIYIPDIYCNGLETETRVDVEKIKKILENCYTGEDFVKECKEHVGVAKELFEFVDWQHPNVEDLLETYDDEDFQQKFGFPKETFEKNEVLSEANREKVDRIVNALRKQCKLQRKSGS